jgi:methanogenic corrinoid protein MtbC1
MNQDRYDDNHSREGMMIEKLIRSAIALTPVPPTAAREYREKLDVLREQVDQNLTAYPGIDELIGGNPLAMMYDNHRNHALFMANVFRFNTFEVLARIAVWVYKSYHAHGFSYDYFPVELTAWMKAVADHLGVAAAPDINRIYRWLLDRHDELIILSQEEVGVTLSLDPAWDQDRERFLAALLHGDHRECLRLAEKTATTPRALEDFYLQVIQPCMYRVGDLWQEGEISVAQEHLASAMVARIMAAVYPRLEPVIPRKGKAVVTAAPNEHHEMGARIVADCLGMAGWEISYLGANTPPADLVKFLTRAKPFLVAISVAMPFNLDQAAEIIAAIKHHPELTEVRILVGGRFFQEFPDLWHVTAADGWAPDARAAVLLAQQWWEKRSPGEG